VACKSIAFIQNFIKTGQLGQKLKGDTPHTCPCAHTRTDNMMISYAYFVP